MRLRIGGSHLRSFFWMRSENAIAVTLMCRSFGPIP